MHSSTLQARGASELVALLRVIHAENNARLEELSEEDANDGLDARDYSRVADLVARSLEHNVTGASAEHRQGYLLALADLFSLFVDGCTESLEAWEPLAASRPQSAGRQLLERMAQR